MKQKLSYYFSEKELKRLINISFEYSSYCIVIWIDIGLIEISTDLRNELDISFLSDKEDRFPSKSLTIKYLFELIDKHPIII